MIRTFWKPPAPLAGRQWFLTTGPRTALIGEESEIVWETKENSRDGYVLPGGNHLITHANAVREYQRDGKVVWEYKLSPDNGELSTALRLADGNTLVNLTHGNKTVIFTPEGKVAWRADNSDTGGRFADPCGAQRLPDGNTIVCSCGQRDAKRVRIFEVTSEKEVVWEYFSPVAGAHEIHVLTTNGKAVEGVPQR